MERNLTRISVTKESFGFGVRTQRQFESTHIGTRECENWCGRWHTWTGHDWRFKFCSSASTSIWYFPLWILCYYAYTHWQEYLLISVEIIKAVDIDLRPPILSLCVKSSCFHIKSPSSRADIHPLKKISATASLTSYLCKLIFAETRYSSFRSDPQLITSYHNDYLSPVCK